MKTAAIAVTAAALAFLAGIAATAHHFAPYVQELDYANNLTTQQTLQNVIAGMVADGADTDDISASIREAMQH